ncbi:tetratricopeptide repeat protein [Brevundimonas pondensis]|uniref:tetratricopeptide repeat protein n=1 Tax=Brevundimonas pondensis TaxID=2774189 RepID=UPI003208055B
MAGSASQKSSDIARVRAFLEERDFKQALDLARTYARQSPRVLQWHAIQAQALSAMQRPLEAIEILEGAMEQAPAQPKLLGLARAIAFQHGHFDKAEKFGAQLLALDPTDQKVSNLNLLSGLAMGRWREIAKRDADLPSSSKAVVYARDTERAEREFPSLIRAWEASLGVYPAPIVSAHAAGHPKVTMIQYWSQGALPRDMAIVFDLWEKLAGRLGIGPIELFSRKTAGDWIKEHAPEFAPAFDAAFHYAMESDIFRIAYASKRPCIYVDADSWPLPEAQSILQAAMQHGKTMLYLRSYRPWILNGLFMAYPRCGFIKELVEQTQHLVVSDMPQTHATIEATFGPTRYNNVLRELLGRPASSSAGSITHGLSSLTHGDLELSITHEAALASVKPPFSLAYKATDGNWKGHGSLA